MTSAKVIKRIGISKLFANILGNITLFGNQLFAQQLNDARTTADFQPHNSCYASAHQLLGAFRNYAFQRLFLYIWKTSSIYSEDLLLIN